MSRICARFPFLFVSLAAGALQCYKGVTNTSAYGGGSDAEPTVCAAAYTFCYTCYAPKGSGGGISPADHWAYGCGNAGFINLLEALGAQDCVTCAPSLCNAAGRTGHVWLAIGAAIVFLLLT